MSSSSNNPSVLYFANSMSGCCIGKFFELESVCTYLRAIVIDASRSQDFPLGLSTWAKARIFYNPICQRKSRCTCALDVIESSKNFIPSVPTAIHAWNFMKLSKSLLAKNQPRKRKIIESWNVSFWEIAQLPQKNQLPMYYFISDYQKFMSLTKCYCSCRFLNQMKLPRRTLQPKICLVYLNLRKFYVSHNLHVDCLEFTRTLLGLILAEWQAKFLFLVRAWSKLGPSWVRANLLGLGIPS